MALTCWEEDSSIGFEASMEYVFNDEFAKWYVETINAFWNFFETPVEGAPEIGADTEEEQFTLIEKMCDAFIVETDDEVYYDAESADDDEKELFIKPYSFGILKK